MASSSNVATVTLSDRLEHGFLTIDELCSLKAIGRTAIYEDIKSGVLVVEKHGRSTRIRGPVARDYVPGLRRHSSGRAA